MKIQIKELIPVLAPKQIKVQLDEKTFIYVLDISSVNVWLYKYPGAKVVAY
jgi:hypothetical protein